MYQTRHKNKNHTEHYQTKIVTINKIKITVQWNSINSLKIIIQQYKRGRATIKSRFSVRTGDFSRGLSLAANDYFRPRWFFRPIPIIIFPFFPPWQRPTPPAHIQVGKSMSANIKHRPGERSRTRKRGAVRSLSFGYPKGVRNNQVSPIGNTCVCIFSGGFSAFFCRVRDKCPPRP